MLQEIIQTSTSNLFTLPAPINQIDSLRLEMDKATAFRILRGTKCRTEHGLFDECGAALQFPYYFGENWAALNDCLRDIRISHPRLMVIVSNARLLLDNDERSRMLFFDVFQSHIQLQDEENFFKLILQETGEDLNELHSWLDDHEITYKALGKASET